MTQRIITTTTILGMLLTTLVTGQALANDPIALKCAAAKLKEAGKYAACRMKVESKAVQRGLAPDYAKCDAKFTAKWEKAEAKAAGDCLTTGDEPTIRQAIQGQTRSLASGLTDSRYIDTGLTVIDNETGLEWAKQVDCGGEPVACSDDPAYCSAPLCMQNTYNWSDTGANPDGNVFTLQLAQMNGQITPAQFPGGGTGCFAGDCDWRLPTLGELSSIHDCTFPETCIAPVFGPTDRARYVSSTSPSAAHVDWVVAVSFDELSGIWEKISIGEKLDYRHMRPVRGGGCIADCTGRTCGDDGCGGTCGYCFDPDSGCHEPSGTCVVG